MIEEAKNIAKETMKDAQEVVRQRFFSPMYFYFILSWIVTNWKFVFAILFIDKEDKAKLDYLVSFYPFHNFGSGAWTIAKLVIIPALSAGIFVWWLSMLSEKFYERNETFKMNKQTIKRKLEYTQKVKIAGEQRKIREAESDKNELRYNDYKSFNDFLNNGHENVAVLGLEYLPSEVLYGTDPENYKEQLNEYLASKN